MVKFYITNILCTALFPKRPFFNDWVHFLLNQTEVVYGTSIHALAITHPTVAVLIYIRFINVHFQVYLDLIYFNQKCSQMPL